ncbi:MAG: sporulation protein YqfC [Clostridiales bacterium]|nr:sporulation protein YqfC [Clostridiales bacterium]
MAKTRRRKAPPSDLPRPGAVQTMAKVLELPAALAGDSPHIELLGNREITVDGCRGILEYDDGFIRLNLGKTVLRLTGRDLVITALSDHTAVIEGYVLSIEFTS